MGLACWTGQRLWPRLKGISWTSKLGGGRGTNNLTSVKISLRSLMMDAGWVTVMKDHGKIISYHFCFSTLNVLIVYGAGRVTGVVKMATEGRR